jgi:hypothetical protein
VSTPGVNYYCENGTYNSVTNKCEVVPALLNVCLSGTYNPVSGVCEVLANTNFICERGVFDPVTKGCNVTATENYVCSNGFYNELLGVCIVEPSEITYYCPNGVLSGDTCVIDAFPIHGFTGIVYLVIIGIVGVIVGGWLFLFLGSKKKGRKR